MHLPARTPHLEIHDSGDDVLVHDRARSKIHVLNRSAAQVLRACDGSTHIETLARTVNGEHPHEVIRDIQRVLRDFASLGLIDA